jgi:hypothetical protein
MQLAINVITLIAVLFFLIRLLFYKRTVFQIVIEDSTLFGIQYNGYVIKFFFRYITFSIYNLDIRDYYQIQSEKLDKFEAGEEI